MSSDSAMTSRLDELFSPDRLRENWKMAPVLESTPAAPNLDIHTQYHELQGLIAGTFPDVSMLSGSFDELTEKIKQTFPLDATAGPIDVKEKEALVIMLEQLETLLWALDLSLKVPQ